MNAFSLILKITFAVSAVIGIIWMIYWTSSSSAPTTASESPGGAQVIGNAIKPPDSAQQIAAGAALYGTHCASCHGVNLQGQANWTTPNANGVPKAPPHDDSGHTWHHDDQTLFNYTKLGGRALMVEAGLTDFVSGMPGFADTLSDTQIKHVLAFIKSRWSQRSQKVQRTRTRAATKN